MPIDINRAAAEELESIMQIDGARARRIVEYRRHHGGFWSWDDVKQVPGFEDALMERLPAAGRLGDAGDTGYASSDGGPARADGARQVGSTAASGRLHLNDASAEDLQRIEGIDDERARLILDHRRAIGRFETWEDVRAVPGIDGARLKTIRRAATIE